MDWQPCRRVGARGGSAGAAAGAGSRTPGTIAVGAAPHASTSRGPRPEEPPRRVDSRWSRSTARGARGAGRSSGPRLTLSLLTGRPFRIVKIRANRDKPGLRPQHLTAVEAAAALGEAEVVGASVGSRDLTFRPGPLHAPRPQIDIGTAGSTALVLQTLHLPLALRADRPVRVTLTGGTFNPTAPSFPFLETTWRAHLAALGRPDRPGDARGRLLSPRAAGGSTPGSSRPSSGRSSRTDRGPLVRIRGVAGVAKLRTRDRRADARPAPRPGSPSAGCAAEIELADWPSPGPGAALSLIGRARPAASPPRSSAWASAASRPRPSPTRPSTSCSPSRTSPTGPSTPTRPTRSSSPWPSPPGASEYTVSDVTEHLRTNVATIRAFLDRDDRASRSRARTAPAGSSSPDADRDRSEIARGPPAAAGSPRLPPRCSATGRTGWRRRRRGWLAPVSGVGRPAGDEGGVEDLGQDAAVHVAGDGDAEQVEDRRGDVEQGRPLGRRPGAERRGRRR